jgi:hypothetical protein
VNGTATTSTGKYLLRGDSKGCISLWNLNHPQNQMEGIKKSNYEMSLAKFWSENFKQDNENVNEKKNIFKQDFKIKAINFYQLKIGSISTFLYLPTIDKLVYGMNDGSIIILPAVDFLIKNLFNRNSNKNSTSMFILVVSI